MPKKICQSARFSDLTWDDLNKWAGGKTVSKGRTYQQQGRVSGLALTGDGDLIAWVDGSKRYAVKVTTDEDGLPESICTCPYAVDCKHGVAAVLEYLERVEDNQPVPEAGKDDERLALLENKKWDDSDDDNDEYVLSEEQHKGIDAFLKGKTKGQLNELIQELAVRHPGIAHDLADRQQIISVDVQSMVTRLRREIRETCAKPGWQNPWQGKGYTPDYSGIRTNLEKLVNEGHADAVWPLCEELVDSGIRQVEESHDEGETAMELEECMPVIVEALERSSLEPADKLAWAVNAVLKDPFDLCDAFARYLDRRHPRAAWQTLADRLLERLNGMNGAKDDGDFSRGYERDRVSDWLIHAMELAGREGEIIPLCETEAKKTGSYARLVTRLISARRYEDAERWIHEGIRATRGKWPGIAANLREKMQQIHTRHKNWPAVAAMQAEEFVRNPSRKTFAECQKAAAKVKAWPQVRERLLVYLETGRLPWKQEGWPLQGSGLDTPEAERGGRFPMLNHLIDIAILEERPDQVLRWYDQLPKDRLGWHAVDENAVATAVLTHAPDRAVEIWQNKAEGLINQVKPSAYQDAATYLRKAKEVMTNEKKLAEWNRYLKELRERHIRKQRLMEILDSLEGVPIIKKRR